MDIKRFCHSIRYLLFFDQLKRAEYAKRNHIFHHIGNNVRLPASLIPLHPELICFHDNIEVASGVKFVVHDAIHGVLNFKFHGTKNNMEFPEFIDCIEIMDNVFIGANSIVLGGVRIGNNVIVGSNSLVNKDIPDNSVYAGIPARKIGNFEDFVSKRREIKSFVSTEESWKNFYAKRHNNYHQRFQ